MQTIVRVGVDLAKNVLQVHAVDAQGKTITNRAIQRSKFLEWCVQLPARCLVVMEACGGAHHWCRHLIRMGFDARMIAAALVSPYRMQGKSGKNDANDAAAICEAASRPQMRFVQVKTLDQQGMLCVHRLREGFKEERTACINRTRGLLAEFGIVLAQSPRVLRAHLHDILEDASNEVAGTARIALQRAFMHWQELDEHIHWCEQRITAHNKQDEQVQRAASIKGLGPLTASAIVATVGDFKQFKYGAQFAAWLGLTPRQHSSGGKSNLGGVTKRGDSYLRSLLVQGAKAAVLTGKHNQDPISQWAIALRQRSGWQKAVVALANKNARILWALMVHERPYEAAHISTRPTQPLFAGA